MEMKNFDVVIVGSGAGGAAAAWRLCSNGLKVLLLEAGPRFDPIRDYPLLTPGWERQGFPQKPGSQAAISYGDLGQLSDTDRDLASWNTVTGLQVSGPNREVGIGYSHVLGVGGSTLHYVGEAHRMHPKSFTLQQDHSIGANWPLSYSDLEPYYAEVEKLIGVAGPEDAEARWRSSPYPLPPHPLSPAAEVLSRAGEQIGMKWQPNARAALSKPYDGRPACNYCANCSRGCPIGDKGSSDVTFIRRAAETGNLTLESEAKVTKIIADKTGRIEAVEFVKNNQIHYQQTPILVMAAGAVQTPRILLSNASADQPNGLANSSGQVGQNFMETLLWRSVGLLPELRMSHAGLPADAISWAYNAPDGVPGAVGGCRFNSNVQETGFVGPIAYGTRIVPGFGRQFKQKMRDAFGSAISVGAIGAIIPDERSFIDLDPERVDKTGMRLPRIHSVLTENSLRLLHFMAKQSRELLAAAGVEELLEEASSWDRFSVSHVFGTCRMGTDSKSSVVTDLGRSHDCSNLFIADASVFPSSGGGESPSLTIHALAMRSADEILTTVSR